VDDEECECEQHCSLIGLRGICIKKFCIEEFFALGGFLALGGLH